MRSWKTGGAALPPRNVLLRRAVRLEELTVSYNVLEGIVALAAGWRAGSIALLSFGIDSGIETLAALVVLQRLRRELQGGGAESPEAGERRTERLVGATLFALCAYVLFEATSTLRHRDAAAPSLAGIVLAALSLLVMPLLAAAKRRTGRALGSRALQADAAETLACAYLSFTLLLGLGLRAACGWWWADPVAALCMLPFILREAIEAWKGEASS